MGNRGVVSSREGRSLNDNVVASDDTAGCAPQPEKKVYVEVTVLAEKVGRTTEDGTIKLKQLAVSQFSVTYTN